MKLRGAFVIVHRYAGLYMAFFLTVAGATGTILAFRPEIDRWLNPGFYSVAHRETMELDPFALRERAESLTDGALVLSVNFARKRDEPLKVKLSGMGMEQEAAHDADTIALIDPYDGTLLRRVSLAPWPVTRESLLPFIVKLHYTLLLGNVGLWLFGVAALLWTLDCFVAFYLTLPAIATTGVPNRRSWWSRWATSWKIRLPASAYRLNFDLHRASGLWLLPMLLLYAWSSVYFNLTTQVYLPTMRCFFDMPEKAGATLPDVAEPASTPTLGWRKAHEVGKTLMGREADQRGFSILDEDSLDYDPGKNVFYYSVRSDRDVAESFSATYVVFDAASGDFRGFDAPTGMSFGYSFTSWIIALHLASVWGLPLKLAVASTGVVVAALSVTGVYIWWKKLLARAGKRPC